MRELSLHILDIATNSIEAKSSRVIIAIEESVAKNLLRITLRDNGSGMSAEMLEKVGDPFFTTRTTRSVGMGLSLFRQAAQQCNGDLSIDSALGKGTTVLAAFRLNSLNRVPLGDMAETMVNLILGAQNVHFCYVHRTDHGKFCFDSYWLLARMAEQNCSIYDVIDPAKEWIRHELQRIQSIA